MNYEDERFCLHCDKDTPHICKDSNHERDSSWDHQECKVCGWYSLGPFGSEYHPPIEDDIEMEHPLSERDNFLQIIKDNPYDTVVRKVYADWLEEHDEPEEADFFRSWTLESRLASEKWLENFVADINEDAYSEEDKGYLSVERLLEGANKFLDNRPSQYLYGITLPFDTPDIVYMKRKEFWVHYQVVSDRRLEDPNYNEVFIGCAC